MKRSVITFAATLLLASGTNCKPTFAAAFQETSQSTSAEKQGPTSTTPEPTTLEPPKEVKVTDVVQDGDIGARLQEILKATNWFQDEEVDVQNGVVVLKGTTKDPKYREWASSLASKTEDAVAVVNHIQVINPPIMDFTPAWTEARQLGRSLVHTLPLLVLAVVLLALTW